MPVRPTPRVSAVADLKDQFQKAAKAVMNLAERPDNDTMLRLYALYKQGSEGDVKGPKPGFFDFVGTAKYEAWEKLAGTSPDDAMKKYVDAVKKLVGLVHGAANPPADPRYLARHVQWPGRAE